MRSRRLAGRVRAGGRRGNRDLRRPVDDPHAVSLRGRTAHLRRDSHVDEGAGELILRRAVAGRDGLELPDDLKPAACSAPLSSSPRRSPARNVASRRAPADLIVTNARIYTVDDAHPVVSAMAVRDGRVQFTGSAREAMALKGASTRVVDLGGRTVIPGMVDAHGAPARARHVAAQRRSRRRHVVRRGRRARRAPRRRRAGRHVDRSGAAGTRTTGATRASPRTTRCRARCRTTPSYSSASTATRCSRTPPRCAPPASPRRRRIPRGGRIERDAAGEPTGVFVDNAQALIDRAIPPPTRDGEARRNRAAIAESHKCGLVGAARCRRVARDAST